MVTFIASIGRYWTFWRLVYPLIRKIWSVKDLEGEILTEYVQ